MSLMAVFNCSFLITLILFLLIIGLIWIHFNQKINDQNIKMNQMVHLLTSMTQEVSLIRQKVGLVYTEEIIDITGNDTEEKINVSDNEFDDDSDESNSDDSDSEESNSDDSDDSESDDSSIEQIEIKSENKLNKLEEKFNKSENKLNKLEEQIIKLEEHPEDLNLEKTKKEIEELSDELLELEEKQLEEQLAELEELEELKVEQPIEYSEQLLEGNDDIQDVTEQIEGQIDKEEYKKMSLNKLKSLVLERKLTSDVSKLKKSDLLTILGIDV